MQEIFKNGIPLRIIAMISELRNDFNDHLKYDAYKNAFSLLFHRTHFNQS